MSNMNLPILYSFRRCPYAMRARMALIYSSIKYEHREILLKDKPKHMLDISPKGTVPVLLLPNNQVIDESLEIMLWAISKNDPDNWFKSDMNLILENDNQFKKSLDRYKYPTRYPDEDTSGARDKGLEFLNILENNIDRNNGYLAKKNLTMIDIAIFPFVRQFANTDREWFDNLELHNLHKWLDKLINSDLFAKAMAKYDLWNE